MEEQLQDVAQLQVVEEQLPEVEEQLLEVEWLILEAGEQAP